MTALEIELLRSKQELGEALNEIYDFEQTQADREIKEKMGKSHDSSGENNNSGSAESHQKKQDEETDGGSGSTVKKISKKDKFKNFFKKHTSNPK